MEILCSAGKFSNFKSKYHAIVIVTLLLNFRSHYSCLPIVCIFQQSMPVHATSSHVPTSAAFLMYGGAMGIMTVVISLMNRPTVTTSHVRILTSNASPEDAFRCHGNVMEIMTVVKETLAMNRPTAVGFQFSFLG